MALETCRDCGTQVSDTAPTCPKCGRVFNRTKSPQLGCASGCLALLLIGALFGVCAEMSSEPESPAERAAREVSNIESNMRVNARIAVEGMLKDPESAEFRNLNIVMKDSIRAVCGEVNARNSFGGYTGFEGFIGLGDGSLVVLRSQVKDREFVKLWNERCAGR